MIRDPSDGSVREPEVLSMCECLACLRDGFQHKSSCQVHNEPALPMGPCDCRKLMIDSGLQTGNSRPGELERLNKSREWLKQFKQEKAK